MCPNTDADLQREDQMSDQMTERSAIPYRFERSHEAAAVVGLDDGMVITVAGRIRRRRDMGGVVFADLQDRSGTAQLLADTPAAIDAIRRFGLGDWIGASGEVTTTRTGHRSLRVDRIDLLAAARLPFPDAGRRIENPEIRFRRRELDLWANPAARELLEARSNIIATIRSFMTSRGFMEVETPLLQHGAGGANARPFRTHHNALGCDLDLRIAPELFLKRLVVGGFERVFEIGRNFRNEGISPRHNPEFTMMEAYQAYADYHDMMSLTEHLVATCAMNLNGRTTVTSEDGREIDLSPPWRRLTMVDAVEAHTGRRIDVGDNPVVAREQARMLGVTVGSTWTAGRVVAEVFDRLCDRHLTGPVFITDHPTEVSPLARSHRSNPGVTERFETFVDGRELANAFSELTDPDVQRARFEAQAAEQAAGDEETMPYDHAFIRALEYGLPPTGGMGIGIDRLVMLLTGATNIREVIAFPILAPEAFRWHEAGRGGGAKQGSVSLHHS